MVAGSSVRRGTPMRALPSGRLRNILKACFAQILLEKSYLNVGKFLRAKSARRGGHGAMPPFGPVIRC